MGATPQTVTTYVDVTDDYDGSKLPDGTEPETFDYEGKTYSAFLSKGNARKLIDALNLVSSFVEKADEVRSSAPARKTPAKKTAGATGANGAPSKYSRLSEADQTAFRTWAAENTPLSADARRIHNKYVEQWEASK